MRNKIMKNALLTILAVLVCTCPVFGLPPDPDNAALLYYQAFCTYEKPDDTMEDIIGELAKGKIGSNPTIAKYIESCQPAIKLAENAGKLTKCNWGTRYSDGLDCEAPHLGQARMLTFIILSDARIALEQGDYDLAIQRCLTARKLGIDIGQDPLTVGFLVEKSIERITNKCIQDILSSHAMELQTLQKLKAQLDEIDSRIKPFEFFFKVEQEVFGMYASPDRIQELLALIDPEKEPCIVNVPEGTRDYILNADEQFCQRNLAYYNKYWDAVFSAIKLPYPQVHDKLKEIEKATESYKENTDAFITALLMPGTFRIYNIGIRHETFSNAVKTAIELYLIKAQTGKLPDELPAGLPKDLFSGMDFKYEKTADGFILRCQGKDLGKDETYEYEFKVK